MASTTPDTSDLIYIGMPLLGSGGIGLLVTNMQVGNLFPAGRGMVITILNGLFGSSSGVFLIFKMCYQNGISIQRIFVVYTFMSLFSFIRTFTLMPRRRIPFNVKSDYNFGICEMYKYKEQSSEQLVVTVDSTKDSPKEQSFRNSVFSSLYVFNVIYFGIL